MLGEIQLPHDAVDAHDVTGRLAADDDDARVQHPLDLDFDVFVVRLAFCAACDGDEGRRQHDKQNQLEVHAEAPFEPRTIGFLNKRMVGTTAAASPKNSEVPIFDDADVVECGESR